MGRIAAESTGVMSAPATFMRVAQNRKPSGARSHSGQGRSRFTAVPNTAPAHMSAIMRGRFTFQAW